MCKRNCIYRTATDGSRMTCGYSAITEHTRTAAIVKELGLPPTHERVKAALKSENCRFYCWNGHGRNEISKTESEAGADLMGEEFMRLYKEGKTDKTIAKATGASRIAVANWRRRMGLETIRDRRKEQRNIKIKELYDKGLTDREIAEQLNLMPQSIYNWRSARALPSNYRKKKTEGGNA